MILAILMKFCGPNRVLYQRIRLFHSPARCQMDDQFTELPIDQLIKPWVLLRPVDAQSIEYLEMKDSIEARGFLNSIAVRPSPSQPGKFEVIDGMYRWVCCQVLGRLTIPAIIKYNISDDDVLALQIQANAIRPETSPLDFARQLQLLQKARPDITLAELSVLVKKNPQWISRILGLLELNLQMQLAVERGEVALENAFMLAMIPAQYRGDYFDRAKTLPTTKFRPIAAAVVKAFKEAVRQGKLDAFFTADFNPVAYLRPLKEIQAEADQSEEGPFIVSTLKCRTPIDGWNAALQWAMNLDRKSVAAQEEAARGKARQRWTHDKETE